MVVTGPCASQFVTTGTNIDETQLQRGRIQSLVILSVVRKNIRRKVRRLSSHDDWEAELTERSGPRQDRATKCMFQGPSL